MVIKNYILFIVVILWLPIPALSQANNAIDSLKLASNTSDTGKKIAIYVQLGWEYRKLYPDSSIYYLNKSLSLLENYSNKDLFPKTYNFIGVAYWYQGNYVQSFDFHSKAKDMAIEMGDSLQYAHALNSLGRLYDGTAAYDRAIEYYENALSIFIKLDDSIGLAYIYSSLGMFHKSQKNFAKALEMINHSLEIRMEEKQWSGVALNYVELSRIYNEENQNDLAYEALQKALEYNKLVPDNQALTAEINTHLAEVYRKKKDFKKSMVLIKEAENITNGIDNPYLSMRVYNEFGNLYYDLFQYDKAIYYHDKVVAATQNSSFMEELKDAYLHLANDYEQIGNLRMSYDNFKKYNEIEIIFLNAEKIRLEQQHETRIALENRTKENELLRIEQQKNQELLAEQELLNFAIVGIAALIFLLLLMFMAYGFKRRRDNALLTDQKNKLADINLQKDTLMNILTHDLMAPFNRIIGLCELSKMSEYKEIKYTKMVAEVSRSGLKLIKNILDVNKLESDNTKENVGTVNLNEVFSSKIENYRKDALGKRITVKSDLEVNSEFVTNQLYLERIIENLLSNAIKYSKLGTEVMVSAQEKNKVLKFIVTDSGPGFTDKDKRILYQKFKTLSARPTGGEDSTGLGLSLVKTLVDKLGGEISLASQVGKGSTFEVMLPALKV
jgi:signal transduction histidine kinase